MPNALHAQIRGLVLGLTPEMTFPEHPVGRQARVLVYRREPTPATPALSGGVAERR